MTIEQWEAVKAGDRIADRWFRGAVRQVFGVSRVQAKNSRLTRTCLTVSSLKSHGAKTHIFETENTGPHRFDFVADGAA